MICLFFTCHPVNPAFPLLTNTSLSSIAGDLTDTCDKLLCKCDRDAAKCLKNSTFQRKFTLWPNWRCGSRQPMCTIYWPKHKFITTEENEFYNQWLYTVATVGTFYSLNYWDTKCLVIVKFVFWLFENNELLGKQGVSIFFFFLSLCWITSLGGVFHWVTE